MVDNDARTSTRQIALASLEPLVGTWKAHDPSGAGGIDGQTTFEWMDGGAFLLQHVEFGEAQGIEIIGYDDESSSLKSHYFDRSGDLLEYTYEISDNRITITIDMPRMKGRFAGTFSDDRDTFSGRWEWTGDGVPQGYDATMTRV